jgi:hypothetical protein
MWYFSRFLKSSLTTDILKGQHIVIFIPQRFSGEFCMKGLQFALRFGWKIDLDEP